SVLLHRHGLPGELTSNVGCEVHSNSERTAKNPRNCSRVSCRDCCTVAGFEPATFGIREPRHEFQIPNSQFLIPSPVVRRSGALGASLTPGTFPASAVLPVPFHRGPGG